MRPIELVLLLIPTEDGHHSRDHEEAAGRETSTNSKSLWGETKPEVHRRQQVPPQIANYCTGIHFSTRGHVAVLRKGKLMNQQKVFSGFLSAYLISFPSHYEMISQNIQKNKTQKNARRHSLRRNFFSADPPELNPEQMGHSGLMSHSRRLPRYGWLEANGTIFFAFFLLFFKM